MTELSGKELEKNYIVFVRALYRELVKQGRANMLHTHRNVVTENDISSLSVDNLTSYYVWASDDSVYYHPKLEISYRSWRLRDTGQIKLNMVYGIKRYNKPVNLNFPDTFNELIIAGLETLNAQWQSYQQTELTIRQLFGDIVRANTVIYCKQNQWRITFLNDEGTSINKLYVWYNTKTDTYILRHDNITSRHLVNTALELFR